MIDYTKDQLGLSNSPVNSTYIYKGHFLIAKDLFKENPFLGVGPKIIFSVTTMKNFKSTLRCTSHPHNTYIQLLAETGILGL